MRKILRPVWKYGEILELRDLARALLATCSGEGWICALETMEHAYPNESIRLDDDIEVFALRAARFGPPPCALKGIGRAFRLAAGFQHGDLLLLGASSDTTTGFSLLLERLEDDDGIAPLAARLLLWRALELRNATGPGRVLLGATLSDAAANSTELPREVLLACIIHLTGCPGTDGGFRIPGDGPILEELIRLVRSAEEPLVRERLIDLLRIDEFSRAALDGLESLRRGRLDATLVRSGHLLRNPVRAELLRGSRFPARVAGRLSRSRQVEDMIARHLPGLLAASALPQDLVNRRLTELARDGAPLAAVLAAQALIERRLEGASGSALEAVRRGASSAPAIGLAAAALPDPVFRSGPVGLQALEEALATAPGWWCATVALLQLEADREATLEVIRRALLGPDPSSCSRAMEVIGRRELVAEFERDLIEVVNGFDDPLRSCGHETGDAPLAAQALGLIARGPTARCARQIVRRLASTSPVLQAAAIMAASDPKASAAVRDGCTLVDLDLLERLSEARDPRVRIAAMRALQSRSRLRSGKVMRRLLEHDSPEFRRTGLEVVRDLGDPALRTGVLRLVEREEHPELITRGRAVLRFLDARRVVPNERRQEALA